MKKGDEKNASEKEIYQLWWEYLKRSEKYKTYCDFLRQVFKKMKKGDLDKQAVFDRVLMSLFPSDKFDSLDIDYMNHYYQNFGDIFTDSFDDWWETDKPSQNKLPIIILNDPNTCKALPFFAKEFKKRQKAKKKSLSPEEALKILAESEYEFIFLAVPMVGSMTMEDISKQIADIRKKWAKKFDIEDFYFRRFSMPVSRIRFTELKRYLRVYDLKKKGLKMKEVIAEINPNQKGDSANVLRAFYMDLQKAKKIIKNVECGSFPEEPQF